MSSKALSDVIVVAPVIRIWSGQVTLRRDEDLSTASGLPPQALVSDGAKRVIDPKALTPLESQRRSVNRELAQLGIRSPMGYLLSPTRETEVHEVMDIRKQRFIAARDDLVGSYTRLCEQWEAKIPGFESLLRRNRPEAKDVAAACDFDYAIYKVEAVESERGRERFEAVAKATTSSLAEDVASNARAILKQSFEGRDSITQRAVNVVRELVRKLEGFTMFDPRILPTAEALKSVLQGLPKVGPLDTSQTLVLGAMLQSMTDPEQLLKIGTVTHHDDEPEADQQDPIPAASPAIAAQREPSTAVLF